MPREPKTVVGKAVKNVGVKLGLVKPERVLTEAEEKKHAAAIRAGSDNLAKRLARLNIENPAGEIDKKVLDGYKMKIGYFIKKLENAPISLDDTIEMDLWMYRSCDDFQEAVRNADIATCESVIEALGYGVVQGHKALTENEKLNREKIMEFRKSRLAEYIKLVNLSAQAWEVNKVIKKDNIILNQKRLERNTKYAAIRDKINNNEAYGKGFDLMKGVNGDILNLPDSPYRTQALELSAEMKAVEDIQADIDLRRQMQASKKGQIRAFEAAISKTKIMLDNQTLNMVGDINEDLKKMMADAKHQLLNEINDMMQIDATLSTFNDTMREIFSDNRLKEYMLSAVEEFDALGALIDEDNESGGGQRIFSGTTNSILN